MISNIRQQETNVLGIQAQSKFFYCICEAIVKMKQ